MKVDEAMLQRACDAWPGGSVPYPAPPSSYLREVLAVALAPYEAPPFKVSSAEWQTVGCFDSRDEAHIRPILERAERTLGVAKAAPVAGEYTLDEATELASEYGQRFKKNHGYSAYDMKEALDKVLPRAAAPADEALEDALERAQETIATLEAKMVAPLTGDERFELEDCRSMHSHGIAVSDRKLDALLRITESRFPKPPVEKTPDELGNILISSLRDEEVDAGTKLVVELVRRANAAKVTP